MSESQILVNSCIKRFSSGKSTFLNAACLTNAKVSEVPFTTIDPNNGIAHVRVKCVCKELNLNDNPQNSTCIEGNRFIPINLMDVAGLVPDAHMGKGLGNRFLNDLSKADVLIHILDVTGSLDKMGKRTSEGLNDPYEDILFLESEINLWFKQILEREDWNKFTKSIAREKGKFINELYKRLSGVKIRKSDIKRALANSNLEDINPSSWSEENLLNFAEKLREISKPILIVANKIDKRNGNEKFKELKKKYDGPIFPCSALAEYFLRKFEEKGFLKYIPGSNNFQIIQKEKVSQKEEETLKGIKEKILNTYKSTGVQEILNYAIFNIVNQICVYPVSDLNNFTDNKNNVLPDAILVKKGMLLRDFVREKIHSELADHFMFGIDARTKKRIGENYELKNNDIIRIVTSK
ncbi:MAG: YchF-related putative GTPase [Promethearchaeota archaeon]